MIILGYRIIKTYIERMSYDYREEVVAILDCA